MALNLQNIKTAKTRVISCDTFTFENTDVSYRCFVKQLKVNSFRHITDLSITFEHPVTVISGSNRTGKTSLLLLLACSHEQFKKMDATSPSPSIRSHSWSDVMTFTSHETTTNNYSFELYWRVGPLERNGEGKRLSTSKAWSGLGKKSTDASRINAKIRDREVRLVDLERMLPARGFTNALYRKANNAARARLSDEVEKAFAYIFNFPSVEIYEVGGHINKFCYLISTPSRPAYSTYNAATGEESLISMLRDIIDSPNSSLVLIDEIEAGFHPSVQRKLVDVVQYISWHHKKQFIITTHSSTVLSSVPFKARRFIENLAGNYIVSEGISPQAARSKMDTIGYPLVHLYCEDDEAEFLIKQILVSMNTASPLFDRTFNVIKSGPINEVLIDYTRHKRNLPQLKNKVGYCAVFDGDYAGDQRYSQYTTAPAEFAAFIYPHLPPEKFLVRSFLDINPSPELEASFTHDDHHTLFEIMINLGLAADKGDARSRCYEAFKQSQHFQRHRDELSNLFTRVSQYFTQLQD
jgi:hypothetical protein